MHETAIAHSLLAAIETESNKQNAKPVIAQISCGTFEAVNDEILKFAFEAIAAGTICQGVKLEIEHKPIKAKCKKCNKSIEFNLIEPNCPYCGCSEFDLLPDSPLLLESIDFDME